MTKKSVLLVLVLLAAVIGPLSTRQANGQIYGEIYLTAVDATTGETLPGACYSVAGQPFCDDDDYNGVVWITNVPPGEYVITEWLAPDGYELVAAFSIYVDPTYPAGSNILVQHFPLTGGEPPVPEESAPQDTAPSPAIEFQYYESPDWGYIFSWDMSKWSITDQSTENAVDRLVIAGPAGTVELLGGQAYGGDPATCLSAAEQNIWTVPGVVNVQNAIDEFGRDFASYGDLQATNTYQVDYASGSSELWQIDCYQLAPGSEVLRITSVATFEQIEQFGVDLDLVLDDVAFPRRSYTSIDESTGSLIGPNLAGCSLAPDPPRLLHDGAGNEVGMATWYRFSNLATQPLAVLVLENTSAVNLSIDTLQFQMLVLDRATRTEIGSIPLWQFEWLLPGGNSSDPVQSIPPGSRSIVILEFQHSFSFEQPPILDIQYLGLASAYDSVASLNTLGCQGGGGRPKPVKA